REATHWSQKTRPNSRVAFYYLFRFLQVGEMSECATDGIERSLKDTLNTSTIANNLKLAIATSNPINRIRFAIVSSALVVYNNRMRSFLCRQILNVECVLAAVTDV